MRSRIETLETELEDALEVSERRIVLLDEIMARPDKKATPDEVTLLTKRPNTLTEGDVPYVLYPFSDDLVALLLEIKSQKRTAKRAEDDSVVAYNPFLLLASDLLLRMVFDFMISELLDKKEPFQFDFIIKDEVHCSPVQIISDGEKVSLFYIDAIGHPINFFYIKSLMKDKNIQSFIHEGGLQSDRSSCAMFSIQHLNHLSNSVFDEKATLGAGAEGSIDSLAPGFIKNTQTLKELPTYLQTHPDASIDKKKKKRLDEHIAQFSITVEVASPQGIVTKSQNYALAYKTHKYLRNALAKLKVLKAEGIEQAETILNTRKDSFDKNLRGVPDRMLYQRMLRHDVKTHPEKIKELVDFAYDTNQPRLIQDIMDAGFDFHRQRWGMSPMDWALQRGHIELVRSLILSSPDKNQDLWGGSYLHHLFSQYQWHDNTLAIAELLKDHGADLNYKNEFGRTIIHQMAGLNPIPGLLFIEKLVSLGLSIDVVDNEGNSPLHFVRHPEMARGLLKHLPEIRVNNKGELPLHMPSFPTEMIPELLAMGININARDTQQNTPLHGCAKTVDVRRLDELIKCGADLHAVDLLGNTPLHRAQNESVITRLIEAGARVNAVNNEGRTALHDATRLISVQTLIQKGADVHAIDHKANTVLHKKADQGIVKALIDAGADVNAPNEDGDTPLYFATLDNLLELLNAGANPSVKNKREMTPWQGKALSSQSWSQAFQQAFQLRDQHSINRLFSLKEKVGFYLNPPISNSELLGYAAKNDDLFHLYQDKFPPSDVAIHLLEQAKPIIPKKHLDHLQKDIQLLQSHPELTVDEVVALLRGGQSRTILNHSSYHCDVVRSLISKLYRPNLKSSEQALSDTTSNVAQMVETLEKYRSEIYKNLHLQPKERQRDLKHLDYLQEDIALLKQSPTLNQEEMLQRLTHGRNVLERMRSTYYKAIIKPLEMSCKSQILERQRLLKDQLKAMHSPSPAASKSPH